MHLTDLPIRFLTTLYAIVLGTPQGNSWLLIAIWLSRLFVFSLLLRTYILPSIPALMSRHLRIRSISLRSIRGLYLRMGRRTIRIERIHFLYSAGSSAPFTIKVDGCSIEIFEPEVLSPSFSRHKRSLTLAYLRHGLWDLVSKVFSLFDPVFRPILRSYAVACLRTFVHVLPSVVESLSFQIRDTKVSLLGSPAATVALGEIRIHAKLSFKEQGESEKGLVKEHYRATRRHRSYSMAAWRRRFVNSIQRAWDTVLDKTKASLEWKLMFSNITASVVGDDDICLNSIVLPGTITVDAQYSFNPAKHTLDTHSLTASVGVEEVHVYETGLQSFLSVLQSFRTPSSPLPPHTIASPKSSSVFSPVLSPSPLTISSTPASANTSYTPVSPIIEALSSTILSRRQYQPCRKLKDVTGRGKISFLGSLSVQVEALKVLPQDWDLESYLTVIRGIRFHGGLSDAANSHIHRQWLGRGEHREEFEADVYGASLSIREIKIQQSAPVTPSTVFLSGYISISAVSSQWPAPWLIPSSFIGGDPNGPLLAVQATFGGFQFAHSVAGLVKVLDKLQKPRQKDKHPLQLSNDKPILPLPRLLLELECGPVGCSLSLDLPLHQRVLELRTDGFAASFMSKYKPRVQDIFANDAFDTLPLTMNFSMVIVTKPTFIRIRNRHISLLSGGFPSFSTSDVEFCDDPAVLSLESLDVVGSGNVLAHIKDDTQNVPCIHSSTLATKLTAMSDALRIELWHPDVISSISNILRLLPSGKQHIDLSPIPAISVADRMPCGIVAALSLRSLVVFVTSPDINPSDTMDLSRGFAMTTTGLSLGYHFVGSHHLHSLGGLLATMDRKQLSLPTEQTVDADGTARILLITSEWAVRSAISTPYESDDPMIIERDDPMLVAQRFFCIPNSSVQVCLSSRPSVGAGDVCNISVQIPRVDLNFALNHVYNCALAIRGIRDMFLPPSYVTRRQGSSSSASTIVANINITTLNVQGLLAKQKLGSRITSLTGLWTSNGPRRLSWIHLSTDVASPETINRWEHGPGHKWNQLLSLSQGSVSLLSGSSAVAVRIDGARLRIPYGYILADLIREITVAVKAVRHIARMAISAKFFAMSPPSAEDAKLVPVVSLEASVLSVEFADDPFESRLGLIWRTGSTASQVRTEREEAFTAKVAAIHADSKTMSGTPGDVRPKYHFSKKHTVDIEDARRRLDEVHLSDWKQRLRLAEGPSLNAQNEHDSVSHDGEIRSHPPLFRITMRNLRLTLNPPSFPFNRLPHFLHEQGGLPFTSQYSLLVPMHLNFSVASVKVDLRDYPIPLVNVPRSMEPDDSGLRFDTDLVIAEEMGSDASIDWVEQPIIQGDLNGQVPLSLLVPKTMMPVKSYANPEIHVSTTGVTTFAWGVSYGPATQDVLRVIETLSHSPRDPSPAIGFWDKLRLIFHWSIRVSFKADVHYLMKGLRDPYPVAGTGAGFLLAWRGNPKILIGRPNADGEIGQVISDTMLVAVPSSRYAEMLSNNEQPERDTDFFNKICAKFRGGVRFGVGFVLERSCGPECQTCTGSPFHRKCRFFDFKPHHAVALQKKKIEPIAHSADDSYAGFRSDFIHLSISLTSSIRPSKPGSAHLPSNVHLSPEIFTHFWRWWSLFDGVLSPPIRQGSYFPRRHRSPKFGRHLATIKYRVCVPRLFLMHAYIDESRDTWADGVTSWIGVKGMIDDFRVDMHQRDQETVVPGPSHQGTKVIRRKPFYAVELVMKGLDLRAVLAFFSEPLKATVPITAPPRKSNYRVWEDLPVADTATSPWYDPDDYVELGWSCRKEPTLHVLPIAACPRFIYFKRNAVTLTTEAASSKFGDEKTHTCLLGAEPPARQVQISLASARISELRTQQIEREKTNSLLDTSSIEKSIALLDQYISILRKHEREQLSPTLSYQYQMPSDVITPDEWAEFDNVYHVHCPKIFMDNAIRDIMLQYYRLSRDRRGLEYYMATRAIKFIRDQAELATPGKKSTAKSHGHINTAQAAALALRRILVGDHASSKDDEPITDTSEEALDPMNGWSDGVSLRKSHCFLLLKPQLVLKNRGVKDDTCIITALQAKLQSFAIMDDLNVEDPVSGKVMSRTYALLSGLQTFSPNRSILSADGCVPLEVLIDFKCESDDFDRLVPQADATFHYDKFNRLRLRNNVTSAVTRTLTEGQGRPNDNHLHDQTDLVQVHVPQFTVTASEQHFQTISKIVTKLLLFTDAAQKIRSDRLETLLFTYDFSDPLSAAEVVKGLQDRVRNARSAAMSAGRRLALNDSIEERQLACKLNAHVRLLEEELTFLFDAIKLAQNHTDEKTDEKSALLLNASSSQISWNMLGDDGDLLAKLVVSDIDFYWLSRQDSGTMNNLTVGNFQAFDGSRNAVWTEILTKYDEHTHHPMQKKGLFLMSNWSVLPPVGGITIYEAFELSLHPLRLQIDARVGRRIMEYVWPARRERKAVQDKSWDSEDIPSGKVRTSLDSAQQTTSSTSHSDHLVPSLRRLGTSRSFTDLRTLASESSTPLLHRTQSSEGLREKNRSQGPNEFLRSKSRMDSDEGSRDAGRGQKTGDAAEMRTRSSQKTFVLVKISSLHLCLSVMKEESFVCHDARIRTRDLEYRNQTWSFEELVDQFIPSDMSWKGWVKMAFHQPLVPVLPVAKELFSKTKWIAAAKNVAHIDTGDVRDRSLLEARRTRVSEDGFVTDDESVSFQRPDTRTPSPSRGWKKTSRRKPQVSSMNVTSLPLSSEPETYEGERPHSRKRMISLFSRTSSKSSRSDKYVGSLSSTATRSQDEECQSNLPSRPSLDQ